MSILLFSAPLLFATSLAAPWLSGDLYLDPGTGSYLLQLLVAGLLGSLMLVKIYWRKIKNFVLRRPEEPLGSDDDDFKAE